MRKHCALKHGIFKEFLAEFLGTFVLVVSIMLYYKSLFFLMLALEVLVYVLISLMC